MVAARDVPVTMVAARDVVTMVLSELDSERVERIFLVSGVGTEEALLDLRHEFGTSCREVLPPKIAESWGTEWPELISKHLTMAHKRTIIDALNLDITKYSGQTAVKLSKDLVKEMKKSE
jgi:hypothetical protein